MSKNIELIESLISQAKGIQYGNGQLDVVLRRADMLIRKIFSNDSHYLTSINKISFSPNIVFGSTPESAYVKSFNNGKNKLLNILNVMAEDILLEETIKEKNVGTNYINNSENIFIVHGHNSQMKESVARTIEKLKLNPIILHEQPNKGKTIIEKFTGNSDVAFAIILLSADDIAYNKSSKPETAKYRARQNVIFELGYFIGKIGRERVIALHEIESNFEIPSDYSGVLFVPFDDAGRWKFDLVKELKESGVKVNANDIL